MRVRVLAVVTAAAVMLPAQALAGVFDSFGHDPRGIAMGGAQVASADDYAAAYFNPSLLAMQEQFTFGFAFNWFDPVMSVHALNQADASRLQLPQQDEFTGTSLGFLFPLGGKVRNRLAIGVGIYLPTGNVLRTEATDPNVPSWYFYQSSPERIYVAASAGLRITDWLSIGGGVQVLGALIGGFDFSLNLFEKRFESRALRADLESRMAPLAGLTFDFKPIGLRVSAGYRGPIEMDYDMPTVFDFPDLGTVNVHMTGVAHYSPHTLTLAAQYQIERATMTAELRYARWRDAPDPSTHVTFDVDGEALAALGLSDTFDAQAGDGSPCFQDTLSVYAGAEYWIVDQRLAVRAGYSFRPTPVPLQNGGTNILDGDTHAVSFGFDVAFDDPLEVFAKPIHVEGGYQRLIISERTAQKESDAEVPSYKYRGDVNALSVGVRYAF